MKILNVKNIKKKKKINILRTLIDKKYFIFYEQIYEKKNCIFDKKHIKEI